MKANDVWITQKVPTSIRMKVFNTYFMTWLNLTFQLRILPYDKTVDETDNLPKTKEDEKRKIDYWNLFIERCIQESKDVQRKNWISTDDVESISSNATIAIPGISKIKIFHNISDLISITSTFFRSCHCCHSWGYCQEGKPTRVDFLEWQEYLQIRKQRTFR